MIGSRHGNLRGVSGEGGSCLYRAVAYQLCEQSSRPYEDAREVTDLRTRVQTYLRDHANDTVPGSDPLKWGDIGPYVGGHAEAPIPQAMAYVIGRPLTVHWQKKMHEYGRALPGKAIHVGLVGDHYIIKYHVQP